MAASGGQQAEATFAVRLNDETTAPSRTMARELTGLRGRIDEQTAAVRRAQSAQARLRSAGLKDTEQAKLLRASIESQKKAIGGLESQYLKLGGTFEKVQKKSASFWASLLRGAVTASGRAGKALAGSRAGQAVGGVLSRVQASPAVARASAALAPTFARLQRVLGPLGKLAGRTFGAMTAGIKAVAGALAKVLRGAAAVAAVVAVLAAAVLGAAAAFGHYVFSVAEARRNEGLHLAGVLAVARAHGRVTASAGEVQEAIDRAADSTATSREQLQGYALAITRAGVRGRSLNTILETTAMVASAAGEQMAESFRGQAVAAARTGRSVDALAQRWRNRFGAIAGAQALGWDRQMLRLRQNIGRLFDGVKIDGFLTDLNRVLSLFSQTNVVGRGLRSMFTALFGSFRTGDWAGWLEDKFERITLWLLRLQNHFLRLRLQLGLGGALVATFLEAVSGVARAAWDAFNSVNWTQLGMDAASALGRALYDGIRAQLGSTRIGRWLGFADVGRQASAGLASAAATQRAGQAGQALGTAAAQGTRDALQVHSPSRVYAAIGRQTAAGFAAGLDQGAGGAQTAAADMVAPPSVPAPARAGRASVTISVDQIHVHGAGEREPRELARNIFDELAALLEGHGITIGAATS